MWFLENRLSLYFYSWAGRRKENVIYSLLHFAHRNLCNCFSKRDIEMPTISLCVMLAVSLPEKMDNFRPPCILHYQDHICCMVRWKNDDWIFKRHCIHNLYGYINSEEIFSEAMTFTGSLIQQVIHMPEKFVILILITGGHILSVILVSISIVILTLFNMWHVVIVNIRFCLLVLKYLIGLQSYFLLARSYGHSQRLWHVIVDAIFVKYLRCMWSFWLCH